MFLVNRYFNDHPFPVDGGANESTYQTSKAEVAFQTGKFFFIGP